jgi:hypothetical protein
VTARRYPWTAELDEQLIAGFIAGDRVKVIAYDLGRPLRVVADRIDALRELGRLGRRNRRWTDADNRVLLAALDAGIGYADLAPVFGCSRAAVKVQAGKARKARPVAEVVRPALWIVPTGPAPEEDRDQLRLDLVA